MLKLTPVAYAERGKTRGGLPILSVAPNSAAEAAGLRYGDILVSLNGSRIDDIDKCIAARDANLHELMARIIRDGAELCVVIRMPRDGSGKHLMSMVDFVVESRTLAANFSR